MRGNLIDLEPVQVWPIPESDLIDVEPMVPTVSHVEVGGKDHEGKKGGLRPQQDEETLVFRVLNALIFTFMSLIHFSPLSLSQMHPSIYYREVRPTNYYSQRVPQPPPPHVSSDRCSHIPVTTRPPPPPYGHPQSRVPTPYQELEDGDGDFDTDNEGGGYEDYGEGFLATARGPPQPYQHPEHGLQAAHPTPGRPLDPSYNRDKKRR